jgi:invasion protein IalB
MCRTTAYVLLAVSVICPAVFISSPAPSKSPTDAEPPPIEYSGWVKSCSTPRQDGQKANTSKVCSTSREGRTEAGLPVVSVSLIEPEGASKRMLRVRLPSPVQLQYGSRIIVDSNAPLSGQFATCLSEGCTTDYDATPELIAKLKNGRSLHIQAINLPGKQLSFSVPLADFGKVNSGPPMSQKAYDEQEKSRAKTVSDGPAVDTAQLAKNLPPIVYSSWTKMCREKEADAPKVCFTGRDAKTETGDPLAAIVFIEREGISKKALRVSLPLPLQVPYGMRIIVDSNGPVTTPLLTCVARICMSDYEATPDLVAKLKTGKTIKIQAINLQGNAITIPMPLDNFAKANSGPAMDPRNAPSEPYLDRLPLRVE